MCPSFGPPYELLDVRRQEHFHTRAFAGLARDLNAAAQALDDLPDNGQAQAGAALLRREERLEDAVLRRLVHAVAGIAHCQLYRALTLTIAGDALASDTLRGDRQRASLAHRIASIETQVHHDLLELVLVGLHEEDVSF